MQFYSQYGEYVAYGNYGILLVCVSESSLSV